jgi:hypothetical protein
MMTRPACGPLAKREDYIRTAVLYSQLLQPPRVLGNICWVFHDNLREKRSQFPEFPYFPVRPKPVLANDRFHARGRKVEQNDHRVVRSTSLLFVRFESFVPPLSEPTAEMSSLAVTASTRW